MNSSKKLSCMPEGTILGQTSFNTFTNNVPEAVRNEVSLYSDEPKLIDSAEPSVTRVSIHEDLYLFSLWFCKCMLEFNI